MKTKQKCKHGVPLDADHRCIDCEIIWEQEQLDTHMQRMLDSHLRLKQLKEERIITTGEGRP